MDQTVLTAEQAVCYHCGDRCRDEIIRLHEKCFCCNGCRMVYEILHDNDLNTYYLLDDQPGRSFRNRTRTARFDYLDDSSVVERLTDFRHHNSISLRLYIPNIHCPSCIWLLENLYKLDPGIVRCGVNFLKQELSLTFDQSQTSLRSVAELLASIGYEPELRLEKLDKKPAPVPDRRLWLKLGIAGFAFGNIMLFSFPEYLSGSSTDESFQLFFGIMNIVLALPVLLYSSSDYLKSGWTAVRQGGMNLDVPITIGIIALFSRSLFEIISGTGAGYLDSFTGLIFFLLIGRVIQKKTYERLSFDRDYKSYLPISVTVTDRSGHEKAVTLDQLKRGSRILIRNQELVPADSLLLSENSFIDYSFITGESELVELKEGETVYAGGKLAGSSAEMSTLEEVSGSYLTKLWNDAAFESSDNPSLRSMADRISPYFTMAIIAIAVISGIYWWPAGAERSVSVFTAVLIIACPCALALSAPFTLGSSLAVFSRNSLYIKSIDVIENLSKATSVVFDKTGTLTETARAGITFHGEPLTPAELSLIKSVCRQSLHPLSRKIVTWLDTEVSVPVQEFDERINRGIIATAGYRNVLVGSAQLLDEHRVEGFVRENESESSVSCVHVAIDGEWKGWFEVTHGYRAGIAGLLDRLRESYSTFLISGDNDTRKNQLASSFEERSLHFRQTPQQKLEFIKELQEKGEQVVMIGDGLNDAGALRQSDFGIALTDDLASFTPACDAIMHGSSLNKLDDLIAFSKRSILIIKLSFGLSLLYNVVGLGFAVTGQLTPLVAAILMPLSSVTIMLFTTGSTWLAARKGGLRTWV